MEIKLYVGNLSYSTTEEDLRTLFAQAGNVVSVTMIKDRFTGQSKGFAFVEMSALADSQKAVTMFNGYKMDDRELKVSPARPREESGNRPGGGHGSGGGDSRRGPRQPRRY